ncbi:MAG: hypothetical protein HDS11_04255 [Bacteroides sp.]|nr:hypothetical protein [Bacteroides sp.]
MARMTSREREQLFLEYKSSIFRQLRALDVTEANATAFMKKYELNITNAFGNTNKSPIITAEWVAKLIVEHRWER